MISVLATNIVSPLGYTTDENYRAVREHRSKLARYESWRGVPEAFVASVFDEKQRSELMIEGYTILESVAIRSIADALAGCRIDVHSPRTKFILSTTKANVDELSSCAEHDANYIAPGALARKVATYFGFKSEPVVVCNACISGMDAQLLAHRLLSSGEYDHAVVCGVDMVTPFVIAGFLSFKSMSLDECRPFDIERTGLNVGEAAATIIFGRNVDDDTPRWQLLSGAMSNDAYHLSAPAPKGDGAYRAMCSALGSYDANLLALISAHGTATMFNDQMESKAIERANLLAVPITALKGYYGHTLGAAGVVEPIINMRSLDDGLVLGVRGFDELGVSAKVDVSAKERSTDKQSFLKMISGFGGCNGALLYAKQRGEYTPAIERHKLNTRHRVVITPEKVVVDSDELNVSASGKALLTEIYKNHIGDYPKYYKMDALSKVLFVASELLMQRFGCECEGKRSSMIIFNSSSSIVSDRKHIATFERSDEFYPSPSIFIGTLPNIALGEFAIKHNCTGETSLYILESRSDALMAEVVESAMSQSDTDIMLTGWVDCSSEDSFEAELVILTK